MSTQLLERPDTTTAPQLEVEEGSDFDHIICHCDLTKGWCGAEVSGTLDAEEAGVECPECEAISLQHEEVCPRGCDCLASERYWYCGIDDMSDDEEDDEDE